jgi:hypothetical protein
MIRMERFAKGKHCGSVCLFISDEDKMFYNNDTCCRGFKIFLLVNDEQAKCTFTLVLGN